MEFTKSNEEYILVNAIENSIRIDSEQSSDILLRSVAKWMAYIGIPKHDVSVELALIVEYLNNFWGFLTVAEFELAWQLSINQKLEETEYYGNFSPMYVSKVLTSYKNYRKQTLIEPLRRKEKKEFEESQKIPTAEEQAETMKDIFRFNYQLLKEKKEILDPLLYIYDFLRKHKWMKVSQIDIDSAMVVAKQRYNEKKTPMFGSIKNDENFDENIKRIAKNYLVEKFLLKSEIDVLINNINSELFTNLE